MAERVRAKKALGQHFLNDLTIARKIAETISFPQTSCIKAEWAGIPILEVGPGMGVLTQFLLQSGRQLKAVELDMESVDYLHKVYPELDVVHADFLKTNLHKIYNSSFALTGNYPYNISSQIFFKVLENHDIIPVVSGMLQKEVAKRICSGPGSKDYGILSVLLQAWYDCHYLFDVPPGVFSPPPKVTSGVLVLTRNSRTDLGVDEGVFKKVVKTAFGQRRKTLRNSLSPLLGKEHPLMQTPLMTLRPERLGVEEFISIAQNVVESQNNK